MKEAHRPTATLSAALAGVLLVVGTGAQESDAPIPRGPFGLSRVTTADGAHASIDDFFLSSDCALCHERQWHEMRGSMHSVAHEDPFYRRFAEMARREAGEEAYTYCSGCHSPAGVVSGLIPTFAEPDLPEVARAGVTCDVCHQVSALTGLDGPWGEPGNASFELTPGRVKRSTYGDIARNPAHTSERADFFSSSEFCASCHTVIHPLNGLRIEHTYDEWKGSVYAEKGIQCQDCHMRDVEDAIRVAFFVGGNVEAGRLAGSERHASMARARLASAAELSIEAPPEAEPGTDVQVAVTVTNVGAGHDLPTSLTELRQMWLHVVARGPGGEVLVESGALDAHGELTPGTARFGSAVVDAAGRETYKPWEAASFAWKRTVPPKGSDSESYTVRLPDDLTGAVTIEARLLYRIAPPHVIDEVMGAEAFEPEVVTMASVEHRIETRRKAR
jgi:hypothetical protein